MSEPEIIRELSERLDRLECAVFRRMPKAEPDGWITNAAETDQASLDFIASEYCAIGVEIGEPKATAFRGVAELKAAGIVGVYLAAPQ